MGPTENEIRKTVEELKDAPAGDVTNAEAYALLVGSTSGDDTAAEKWRGPPSSSALD